VCSFKLAAIIIVSFNRRKLVPIVQCIIGDYWFDTWNIDIELERMHDWSALGTFLYITR